MIGSRERRRDQHRGEEIKGDERIGERKGVRGLNVSYSRIQ